jgi:hypothetical protein
LDLLSSLRSSRNRVPLLPAEHRHVVWISKDVPEDGQALDNVFIISTEWWTRSKQGGECYAVIAASFAVDFERCSTQIAGDKIIETYFQPRLVDHQLPSASLVVGQGPILTLSSLAAATVGAAVFIASVPLLAALARLY